MKNVLTKAVLMLALAVTAGAPAALAKARKPRYTSAHAAAARKCNEDYKAALKAAKGLKGKERKDAQARARQEQKQCLATTPR